MPVRHKKVSGAAAPADPAKVGGPDWDADHSFPALILEVFRDGSAANVVTNLPAALTEFVNGPQRARIIYDTSNVNECRIAISQVAAGSTGTEIRFQYSTDGGTNWAYFDGTSGPRVNGATVGVKVGAWVPLTAEAKAVDVLIRTVTIGGDGVADPSYFYFQLHVR